MATTNAYFSASLLRAVLVEGGLGADVDEPRWWHRDDPGLALKKSHLDIRCDDDEYELVLPEGDETTVKRVAGALESFATDDRGRVIVRQSPGNGRLIDTEDRIQLSLRLVAALVAAGL